MKDITVYFFEKWDNKEGKNIRSKRHATLDAIAVARGRAIIESALQVDKSELDDNGFRKKKDT